MRLLLDSHVLVAIGQRALKARYPAIDRTIMGGEARTYASAASLWELAIKVRLGRLDVGVALRDFARVLEQAGLQMLAVDSRHAVAALDPEPPTRDPFDRMLLAQCAVENLRLVTVDRALVGHPLAWRSD